MCGITGLLTSTSSLSRDRIYTLVRRMAGPLTHRGPDGHGEWVSADQLIGFAHRRLSIIDLSDAGTQPMVSGCGRYVITFNGEIYNYQDLRDDLRGGGVTLRGGSDTEVLLEAIAHLGLAEALQRINGMFAFALWDMKSGTLSLARDRMGQKPLYYGWAGRQFVFGSQLAALRAHPQFDARIDEHALAPYLRYGMIPAPYSIHPQAWKLPPGQLLQIDLEMIARQTLPDPVPYWSVTQVARDGAADPWTGDDTATIDTLDELLTDAVRHCMVADVPLGAFLSGGIDSSTVVALMQKQSDRPVRTFSIGFEVPGYNEAEAAAAVASHLGTDHTELYLSAADAQAAIPDLPKIYDEPFADASQLPTYLVSRLAREHVTVSLSGDGGDESFAGYNRYSWARRIADLSRFTPAGGRHAVARSIAALPPSAWDRVFSMLRPLLPKPLQQSQAGDKLAKIADILTCRDAAEVYGWLVSQWKEPTQALVHAAEAPTLPMQPDRWPAMPTSAEQYMLLDMLCYLPDDILVKLDRASMAVGLESRAPLLDHRVIEFAWRLPLSVKLRDGKGKWPLRQVLRRYLPDTLIERPKMGFGVPIHEWLRSDLRDWAEHLLDPKRLEEGGVFDVTTVREAWRHHLSGRRNLQYQLWPVLMFEAWRDYTYTEPLAEVV